MSAQTLHRLEPGDLRALASGPGPVRALEVLADTQVSLLKIEIVELARELPGATREALVGLTTLLDAAAAAAPEVVSGRDGLLRSPFLRVWVRSPDRHLAYLAAGALEACARAGVDAAVEVEIPSGGLVVPGAGRIETDHARGRLRAVEGQLLLEPAGRRVPVVNLRPVGPPIRLDAEDPHRSVFGHPLAEPGEELLWREVLGQALAIAESDFPDHAATFPVMLRTIVPLLRPSNGGRASSAATVFGAVAISRPERPERLVEHLLHELQHVKLYALSELVPLYGEDDGSRYTVPWRPDPRPLGPALQGAYAHLAVADFWRRMRARPGERAEATRQYDHWRTGTAEVVETISAASGLTPAGRDFVDGIREGLG